jgi:glycogen synthase
MKDLVESGLSATQEKTDMLQRVKMEINEMVKERVVAKAKVISMCNKYEACIILLMFAFMFVI